MKESPGVKQTQGLLPQLRKKLLNSMQEQINKKSTTSPSHMPPYQFKAQNKPEFDQQRAYPNTIESLKTQSKMLSQK